MDDAREWKLTSAKVLTLSDFQEAVDTIFRDHGIFGRHSKRCVYLKDDRGATRWCCADDCKMKHG